MEDFPSNSQRARAGPRKEEKAKVDKVIQGEVVRRKKPLGKRLFETFIGGDLKGVVSYMTFDILVPSSKDIFIDVVQSGVERLFYGDSRPPSRRSGRRPGGSYIAYNRYSRDSRDDPRDRDRDRPSISRRGRANFDFDEIILDTRVEADEVIERMFDLVSKYEMVTVADLYDLVGIQGNYTDHKYGWEDIRGAGVTRVSNGYLLDLPKPDPLR